jgi:superfamily II DNA helicase RecQ
MPGFTLVVAPITALVRKGAASSGSWLPWGSGVFLDAETPVADRNLILKRIREHDQNLLLVHVTPAMLVESGPFRSALADALICRVVLDEFHTIEEWGFYAAMNDVCDAITRLPGRPPFTLLTATTSTRVTAELLRRLDAGAVLVEQPMVRPHVHLGVTVLGGSGSSKQLCLAMARWIKFHHPDTSDLGVVFTPTPADCDHLVRGLAKLGIMALLYHGDMPRREDKECALLVWATGKIQVAQKNKKQTHIYPHLLKCQSFIFLSYFFFSFR